MNIKKNLPVLFPAMVLFLLQGCAVVKQSIFLQNVDVSGPINQPPLHITEGQKKNTVTFSPNIYINSQKNYSGYISGHTNVNSMGIFQFDTVHYDDGTSGYKESVANKYPYAGQNFTWTLPDVQVGFQVDAALSNHFAVSGGFNYAEANRNKLINGNIGIGFFTEKNNSAVRFDMGLLFQNIFYNASSVVFTTITPVFGSGKSYISFFKDRNNSTATDFYGTLTYNTTGKDNLINFYFCLGYFGQTVLNYKPDNPDINKFPFSHSNVEEDTRGDIFTSFLYFAPGIYKEFEEWGRISFGVRLLKETKIQNSSGSLFAVPVVQFDMTF